MKLICSKCGWIGTDRRVVYLGIMPGSYHDYERYCVCPRCKNADAVMRGEGTLRKAEK